MSGRRAFTDDELSAAVAVARGEKRTRNVIRSVDINGSYFGPEEAFYPWPTPYANDMNHAGKLADEMAAAFTLHITSISRGRWVCTGGPLGADTDLAGDTMAEAICNAYLVFMRKLR